MDKFMVTAVTVPNEEQGLLIAKALVEDRLAACVTLIHGLISIYRWKGEICKEGEMLLWIKSRKSLTRPLQKRIQQLHPYEVPEIISLTIAEGLPEYLSWIHAETGENTTAAERRPADG
jgi:periplasmic divalent cation tolerance protein